MDAVRFVWILVGISIYEGFSCRGIFALNMALRLHKASCLWHAFSVCGAFSIDRTASLELLCPFVKAYPFAKVSPPLLGCHSASMIAQLDLRGTLVPIYAKRGSAFANSAAHSSASLSLALRKVFIKISIPLLDCQPKHDQWHYH